MTLRQLLVEMNLRVTHPEVFGNMELEGFSTNNPIYCPLRMERYLNSSQFQKDLEDMQFELQDRIEHGYDPSDFQIFIERDEEFGYHFDLDMVYTDLEEQ